MNKFILCAAMAAPLPWIGAAVAQTSAASAAHVAPAAPGAPGASAPAASTERAAPASHAEHAASAAPASHAEHAAGAAPASSGPTPPHNAKAVVYIGWPNDGQVMPAGRPFRVWFGLRDMGVAPSHVQFPNTGHHHLLVDTNLPPMDQPIPSDRNHLHFGAGETETMLELPPGKHTLQLLLGDADHVPHKPPVYSKKITIYVK